MEDVERRRQAPGAEEALAPPQEEGDFINQAATAEDIIDRILARLEARGGQTPESATKETLHTEADRFRATAKHEAGETQAALAQDEETVKNILGEDDPAVAVLQALEHQVDENSTEFIDSLPDLTDDDDLDEDEEIMELPDEDVEIIGDIEEKKDAGDIEDPLPIEIPKIEVPKPEIPIPAPVVAQEQTPEINLSALDAKFHPFLGGFAGNFDVRDMHDPRDRAFYQQLGDATLRELSSIIEKKVGDANIIPFFFFNTRGRTGRQEGSPIIQVNLKEYGWQRELERAIGAMSAAERRRTAPKKPKPPREEDIPEPAPVLEFKQPPQKEVAPEVPPSEQAAAQEATEEEIQNFVGNLFDQVFYDRKLAGKPVPDLLRQFIPELLQIIKEEGTTPPPEAFRYYIEKLVDIPWHDYEQDTLQEIANEGARLFAEHPDLQSAIEALRPPSIQAA